MSLQLTLSAALTLLPLGAMYALQAGGFVLVYRTTGVFNFAQTGIGLLAAYLAGYLWHSEHLPVGVAALVVLAVSAGVGAVIEASSVRWARGALARTVVTFGWLVVLQAVVVFVFGQASGRPSMPLLPVRRLVSIHAIYLNYGVDQVGTVVAAALVAGLLALLLSRTATGTAMRALADDPSAARLLGIRVPRVLSLTWALGGAIAGLTGMLVAPLLGPLDTFSLFVLTVEGLAAAVVGRLTSLPLTFAGGLGLALAQGLVHRALPRVTGTNELVALLVLLVALLTRRRTGRADVSDGGLTLAAIPVAWSRRLRRRAALAVAVTALVLPLLGGATWNLHLAEAGAWSLVGLSLVLLTGIAGQVSVCQGVFMGVGAFATAIGIGHGLPFLLAVAVGGLAAGVAAAAVGLPALRLAPLEVAVTTLAVAFTADQFLYSFTPFASASNERPLPRPGWAAAFGVHPLLGARAYAWLLLTVLAGAALAVTAVRRGRTGAALTALRSSEAAVAAMGFSVVRTKLAGFAAAGVLAGVAGGLYGGIAGTASGKVFDTSRSLTLLAFAVIAGVSSVGGCVVGGLLLVASTLTGSGSGLADVRLTQVITGLTGVALIVVVVLSPEGLAGLLRAGLARVRRPAVPSPPTSPPSSPPSGPPSGAPLGAEPGAVPGVPVAAAAG